MRLDIPLTLAIVLALPAAAAAAPPVVDRPEVQPPEVQPSTEKPERDRANNISIGTGGGGIVEFADAFAGNVVGTYDKRQREGRIQVNARTDREWGRWVRYGLAWTYNRWTDALYYRGDRVGAIENHVHALMADATVRWYRTDTFEFYSALALGGARWSQVGTGIALNHDGHVETAVAFQLRYAGLSVGNERVRGFVDLGIGFEGLLVGGLTVRF